jgi:hypothetical protein
MKRDQIKVGQLVRQNGKYWPFDETRNVGIIITVLNRTSVKVRFFNGDIKYYYVNNLDAVQNEMA